MLVIFSGPTLSSSEIQRLQPDAHCSGPASAGDVYRATQLGASVIGLVDGYFEHRLAVWHKEILWALHRGVRVYGAASMGALRAAELAPFGMRGVGKIFADYSSGALVDDDEVAVVHESEDRDFRAQSEALVNVRATLEKAVETGVLTRPSADRFIELLKGRFYPERSFALLRQVLLESHADLAEYERLEAFLAQHGPVNQKRLDALEMLETIQRDNRDDSALQARSSEAFRFEHTDAWEKLRSLIDSELRGNGMAPPVARDVWHAALEHTLALVLAEVAGHQVDPDALQAGSESFRRARGLITEEQTAQWLKARGLDLEGFSRLIYDDLLARPFQNRARELAVASVSHVLHHTAMSAREDRETGPS